MARGIAGLIVFIATFFSSVPAAAQDIGPTPTAEWSVIVAPAMVAEIAVLAELDAFRADPTVDKILEWWEPLGEGRDILVDELQFIDDSNESLLALLDPAETQLISAPVRLALDFLPREAVQRIEDGETGFLDAAPWLDALTDVIVRRGMSPIARHAAERSVIFDVFDELDSADSADMTQWFDPSTIAPGSPAGSPQPQPATAAETAPDTDATAADASTTDAPDDEASAAAQALWGTDAFDPDNPSLPFWGDGDDGGGLPAPVIPAVGGAAGIGVLAVAVIAVRRRRRRPAEPAPDPIPTIRAQQAGLTDVLDTTRRMTAALDETEIQTIAVSESVRLTNAEAGAFVTTGPDGPRYAVRSIPELFSDQPITGGALGRVMETGQAAQLVSDDEPSLARLPAALAAVPVIANGGVAGAIVVIRRAIEPFDVNDVRSLEMLAPVTGSALRAAAAHSTAVTAADRDGLTDLHNRRRLDHDLGEMGDQQAVGFAMVDVDFFKNFNDTHGHAAGDEVLRLVARTIAENVRPEDTVYRYGGEEFSVLLRQCTDAEALDVMERVRQAVEHIDLSRVVSAEPSTVTVSVGLATAADGRPSELPGVADAALYEAKHAGRNRVVTAH